MMSIFSNPLKPPVQALMVFAASLVLMLGGVLLDKLGILEMERLYPWSIATAFMLLFAIANSIMSLQSDNFNQYWGASMYSYIALAALSGLAAWLLSGVTISNAESYKAIYMVVTFGFLVFLSMVNFIRKIINFAETEDWQAPRRGK